MSRRLYTLIVILATILTGASAQDVGENQTSVGENQTPVGEYQTSDGTPRALLTQAEQDYQIGRLDQALQLLTANEKSFKGNNLQNAYRLIALCYLGQDNINQAEAYTKLLLSENPFYTSVQDPIRFEEMVMRLKLNKGLTVTTASSQEEQIYEAPVPVTIITREMIDNLSYNKDLNAILSTYVPGLTDVATYGMDNVAMHGVYTSGQEKILIMEDGHRLNARSTNNGKLDYAISTRKIDHIEVLRGPASSLYGNVALTAVVNIITRQGADIDGIECKYGIGTYGTHRADITAGTTYMGADIIGWASIYTSAGDKQFIPQNTGYSNTGHDGYAYIGRYGGKPSYDLGCAIKVKDARLMLNRKYGKQVPQYSLYGEVYDYDRYRQISGTKAGYSIDETHLELSYGKTFGKFSFNVSAYGDWYQFTDYSPASDSIATYKFNSNGSVAVDEEGKPIVKLYHGLYQDVWWEEFTVGGMARAEYSYTLGSMKGNLLLGTQYEYFRMADTYSMLGEDYDAVVFMLSETNNMILTGRERSTSVFLQDKHYITPRLIVNAGLRYDNKYRKNEKHVEALSPRVALIYTTGEALSAKISYARSFVDAPYFYRQNNTNTYRGSQDLMPEYMNALQFDILGTLPRIHLSYDVNIYYNLLTDIINNTQNSETSSTKYRNSGRLKMLGVEAEVAYSHNPWQARLTMGWQHVLSAEDYYYADHHIYSVPSAMGNLSLAYRLLNSPRHRLWIYGNVKYRSKTLEHTTVRGKPVGDDYYFDPTAIVDLGLRYTYGHSLELTVGCENLLNTNLRYGGTCYFPYQRLGRTAMATVSFKL